MSYDLDAAIRYLETGGLGETMGFIEMYRGLGHEKQIVDADHLMALCVLAAEALDARKKRSLQ